MSGEQAAGTDGGRDFKAAVGEGRGGNGTGGDAERYPWAPGF